jgi:integrase
LKKATTSEKQRHGKGEVKTVTVNRELASIRHLFRKFKEWDWITVNPAGKVKDLPDDGEIHEEFLSSQEYELRISQADIKNSKPWIPPNEPFENPKELIMLDCNTGLRISELLFLEFSDIDLERRILRVQNKTHLHFHVKNYQERHIPLNAHALGAIESMLSTRHPSSNFVFPKTDGSRWTDLHNSFNTLVKRCGLEAAPPFNVTQHTIRHTFGSWPATAGGPLRTIQKLMGPKSIRCSPAN